MTQLVFRNGTEQDTTLILRFITELAIHEGIEKDVVATESGLHKALFQEKSAEVIIAEYEGEPVGFALFFHNFSTLLGKKGLYLERPLHHSRNARKRLWNKIFQLFIQTRFITRLRQI